MSGHSRPQGIARVDDTHDPARRSWVSSANQAGSEFPLQNLPFGVFRRDGGEPRGGVAIGDFVLDVQAALDARLFTGSDADAARAAAGPSLQPLLQLGRSASNAIRRRLWELLQKGGKGASEAEGRASSLLVPLSEVELLLPVTPRSFTDFSSSVHHVKRIGAGGPVHPSFFRVPVAYNGRASSIRPSRTSVRRPLGLFGETGERGLIAAEPMLDFELELGAWLSGDTTLGEPLSVTAAAGCSFGFALVNDWSARAIQFFEMGLGPFLGKSFMTTVSPWIVTAEALAPFRCAAPSGEDTIAVLPSHLVEADDQKHGGLSIELEALIHSAAQREQGLGPQVIVRTHSRYLGWTFAQLIAHQGSNGGDVCTGDLVATGTVSGPSDESRACFAEISEMGRRSIKLDGGEQRSFLADGDELCLRGRAQADGFVSIGFGSCAGKIVAAHKPARDL